MSKKRGGAPHEEHADESWLLPYSDMMTLLLALFIVMFAVSSVDQEKYNAMMESMYTAFGGTTNSGQPNEPGGGGGGGGIGNIFADGKPGGLGSLYLSLNEYVDDEDLSNSIEVQYQGDDVLVTLKNDSFFKPGSAELSPQMREQAHAIAALLEKNQDPDKPFEIVVAGHTDNVPHNTPEYPSNWYLSLMRAANFLSAIFEETSLNASHFSARGYGEFAPVATNETVDGRQQNRRVEVLISEKKEQGPGSTGEDTSTSISSQLAISVPPLEPKKEE